MGKFKFIIPTMQCVLEIYPMIKSCDICHDFLSSQHATVFFPPTCSVNNILFMWLNCSLSFVLRMEYGGNILADEMVVDVSIVDFWLSYLIDKSKVPCPRMHTHWPWQGVEHTTCWSWSTQYTQWANILLYSVLKWLCNTVVLSCTSIPLMLWCDQFDHGSRQAKCDVSHV